MTVQRALINTVVPKVERGLPQIVGEKLGEGIGHLGKGLGEGLVNGTRGTWHAMEWISRRGLLPPVSDATLDRTADGIVRGAVNSVKGVGKAAKFVDQDLGLNRVVTDEVTERIANGIWKGVSSTFRTVVDAFQAFDKTSFGQAVNRGVDKVI